MNLFFKEFIEASLENLPVLQSTHSERKKSQEFRLTQTIYRLVYTEFDHKLSRYLSATRGEVFPAFSVRVEFSGAQSKDPAKQLASVLHESMPDALMDIAKRAVDRVGPVEVALQRSLSTKGKQSPILHKRKLAAGDVEMLGTVLGICRSLGDLDYLEISGDFDAIVATPPGGLNPVILHLQNGSVQVPSEPTGGGTPFQWPVYAYADRASSNPSAQSFLASVGQAIVAEKEAAIFAFRTAAERRITDFQRALDGRPLTGHWLKGAKGLVARLQVGLGDDLKGISEDAQGIAFELADGIENPVRENPARASVVAAPAEEPEMLLVNPVDEPEMVLSNPTPKPVEPAVAAVPEAEVRTVVFVSDPEDRPADPAPVPEVDSADTGFAPVTQVADPVPEPEIMPAGAAAEPETTPVDPEPAPEELPVDIEPEMDWAASDPEPDPEMVSIDSDPELEETPVESDPEPETPSGDPGVEPEVPSADPDPEETPVDPDPEPEMPWAASAPEPEEVSAGLNPEPEEMPVDPDPEPEEPPVNPAPEPEAPPLNPDPEPEMPWAASHEEPEAPPADPKVEPEHPWADPALEPEELPDDPDPEPEMPWAASAPEPEMPSADPEPDPEPELEQPWADPEPEPEIRLVASAEEPEMPLDDPDAEPEASLDDPDRYRRIPLLLGDLAF